jgi:putative acetyltransferase
MIDYLIRRECEADYQTIEHLTREAFWNLYVPGCDEHFLVHTMRSHPDYLHDMAFVAEFEGTIIGSIMYTKSTVENELGERLETATFGPLCVAPHYQRMGIGTALIEHTRRIAMEKGFPAILILGDPHNYCKHGFKSCKDFNVRTKEGKYPLGLMVLELKEGAFKDHSWTFKESDAYELNKEAVEEYDRRFPYKEKKHHYSQELFSMLVRAVVE